MRIGNCRQRIARINHWLHNASIEQRQDLGRESLRDCNLFGEGPSPKHRPDEAGSFGQHHSDIHLGAPSTHGANLHNATTHAHRSNVLVDVIPTDDIEHNIDAHAIRE